MTCAFGARAHREYAAAAGVACRCGVLGLAHRIAEPAGPTWSGTTELKYAYRLTSIELYEVTGGGAVLQTGPYDSAWWLPTHRPGVAAPETPASSKTFTISQPCLSAT